MSMKLRDDYNNDWYILWWFFFRVYYIPCSSLSRFLVFLLSFSTLFSRSWSLVCPAEKMGSRQTHRDDPLIRDPSADGNDFASGTTMVQQASSVPVPVVPLDIAQFVTNICGLPLEGPFTTLLPANRRIRLRDMIGEDILLFLHFQPLLEEVQPPPPAPIPVMTRPLILQGEGTFAEGLFQGLFLLIIFLVKL